MDISGNMPITINFFDFISIHVLFITWKICPTICNLLCRFTISNMSYLLCYKHRFIFLSLRIGTNGVDLASSNEDQLIRCEPVGVSFRTWILIEEILVSLIWTKKRRWQWNFLGQPWKYCWTWPWCKTTCQQVCVDNDHEPKLWTKNTLRCHNFGGL
jgi:hypothetical protein